MSRFREKSMGWDWITILIVSALLLMGVINTYSAAYNPDRPYLFDFNTLYGKQIIWIGVGLFLGIVISLIDSEYIRKLTPIAFLIVLVLLILVLFTEPIKGARSWLGVGSLGIQPSEFSKLTTALMISYIISVGRGKTISRQSLFYTLGVLILIMSLILLQNDTGTFLVYTSFFFVMYREGMTFDPFILFLLNRILGFRYKKTWVGVHFIPVIFVVVLFCIIILYFTESKYIFSFLPGFDVQGWVLLISGLTITAAIIFLTIQFFSSQRSR